MGRLAGIPAFLGHEGDEEDKRLLNGLTRADRDLKALATKPGADQARVLRGQDPTSTEEHQAWTLAGQLYVAHAKDGWGDRLIRRSNNSVSYDGVTPITQGVPALTVVDAYTPIPPDEIDAMDDAVMRLEET